jgi:hypothetical protein
MLKSSGFTIGISVTLSLLASVAVNVAFRRQSPHTPSGVIRARGVELVDSQGRVRGEFKLSELQEHSVAPQLVLRDEDGRVSAVLTLDRRRDGYLSYASDHWSEGAVVLGHLVNADDGSESTQRSVPGTTGAWGLRVRGSESSFTGVGFFNSGRALVPATASAQH